MIKTWTCKNCGAMNSDWRTHCHKCFTSRPRNPLEHRVKKITIFSKEVRITQ